MFMLLFEIVTVGFPFCVFKLVSGLFFHQQWLLGWGIIDLGFNAINMISLLLLKRRIVDTCFLSFLVKVIKRPRPERKPKWLDFGNALDVFASFLLVAFVIGGGYIPQFPMSYLAAWNISVILNVIGAGSSRMQSSIQELKKRG